jgi:hypothetical protein
MAISCLCILCMLLKPNALAANLGGGLDLRANRRISFRLIEAYYLITTFDNGVNDHQNNLRLSTSLMLHF